MNPVAGFIQTPVFSILLHEGPEFPGSGGDQKTLEQWFVLVFDLHVSHLDLFFDSVSIYKIQL